MAIINKAKEKYIPPFHTKEQMFKHFGYKDLPPQEREYIKRMNDQKYEKCFEEATLLDCFDIGYFLYIIHR